MKHTISPTPIIKRIYSLDFLRGIAILGILFINIESFVYPNPWSSWQYGYASTIDYDTRFWVYFLTQGKFYTMFALLFGVGFAIFLKRVEQNTFGLNGIDIYLRRLLLLFLIGCIHSYFIWDGDILHHYAICGLFLLPFRSISNKSIIFVILVLASCLLLKSYQNVIDEQKTYTSYTIALDKTEKDKTEKDKKLIQSWEKRYSKKVSDFSEISPPKTTYWKGVLLTYKNLKIHKGNFYFQSLVLSSLIVMLLGIILYRNGIFENYKEWKFYWSVTIILLSIGLFINYIRYYQWTYEDHIPNLSILKTLLFTFSKEILGIAYILFFNGIYQKYLTNVKVKIFTNIGRTALSNYIFQSVILGFIFYGYGFGLYNSFSRFQLLAFIIIIWIIQIIATLIWLNFYKQGPLEFIWKKLTYSPFNNK